MRRLGINIGFLKSRNTAAAAVAFIVNAYSELRGLFKRDAYISGNIIGVYTLFCARLLIKLSIIYRARDIRPLLSRNESRQAQQANDGKKKLVYKSFDTFLMSASLVLYYRISVF